MDSNSENPVPLRDKGFSRRKFLAGVGLGAGLLTLKAVVSETEPKETKVEGPIKVGNLNITLLSTEHSASDWQVNKDAIASYIDQAAIVIPEYFPQEYAALEQSTNPVIARHIQKFRDANALFNGVADVARDKQKNLVVLDPAYGKEYITLYQALLAADVSVDAAIMYPLASFIYSPIEKKKPGVMSRREFLRFIGYKAVQLGLGVAISKGAEEVIYHKTQRDLRPANNVIRDFRRVAAAHALIELGSRVQEPTNTLLIYPEAHMREIKRYLQNDKDRETSFNLYSTLKEIDYLKPLFEIRSYEQKNGEWEKVDSFST